MEKQKVYKSALVILPPEDVASSLQEIRLKYDKKAQLWPPHINLLHPFIPPRFFSQHVLLSRLSLLMIQVDVIQQYISVIPPFEITLSGVDHFELRRGDSLYAIPETKVNFAFVCLVRSPFLGGRNHPPPSICSAGALPFLR